MSPFSFISAMNLSKEDKFGLFLLLVGLREATRVDIYKTMDSPDVIMVALVKIGFCFAKMRTSGAPGHLSGLIVAKRKEMLNESLEAIKNRDQTKIFELMGYQPEFPITNVNLQLLKQLKDKAPEFYNELVQERLIAA